MEVRPRLERLFFIISSGHSGNAGAGMMMKILDSGVQAEKRLRPFPPLESKLLSLLTSCESMRLFDHVVTSGRGDDLLVVNFSQACDLSDHGPLACELVRANPVWDIIFTQEPGQ